LHRRLVFAEDVDHRHLQKLMAEELMLSKVPCRKPCRDAFEVNGVKLSSLPVKIPQKSEAYHLVAEVLKS
jgi:hypothetical protein